MKNYIQNIIAFVAGLGYYGIALLGWAVLAFVLGFGFIGWALVGAFIGKNAQAIKEDLKKMYK